MNRRSILMGSLSLAASTALPPFVRSVAAQSQVTRIVVPYAAGGAADLTARTFADKVRGAGLPNVIVENKPGASARLGLELVKNAAPDGMTMLLTPSPMLTIYPWTYKNLGYDPDKDLLPVAMLVEIPTAIGTSLGQPYKDMKAFVAWIRQNPSRASIGLATLGSAGHLGALALGKDLGIEITPVGYKGAAPMLVDVASGQVAIGWDAAASMERLYRGGKIHLLGVSGTRRVPSMPEVPTIKEQGFAQFEAATSFYGIYVPAGTPAERIAALHKAFIAAAAEPDLQAKLGESGLVVMPQTGAEMAERARRERAYWEPVARQSGLVLD